MSESKPDLRLPEQSSGPSVDPVEQNYLPPVSNYALGLSVLGVGNEFPGFQVAYAPPDTNMAVGDTQIVQWVNRSFAIFNKFNGTVLAGPIAGNLLFSALGGPCATFNDGQATAQWDNAAHQWLLAQNVTEGTAYYACVAVSMTADATGAYYLYQFPLSTYLPDQAKWGRWNTSWMQAFNNFVPTPPHAFVGAEVCVYERAKLLTNSSPRQVCFQLSSTDSCLLPADIDSPDNPPSAEDQFLIGSVAVPNTSHLSLYSVDINWLHPSQALITGKNNTQLTSVATYSGPCNGVFRANCVPQKGVNPPDYLDTQGDRLMYRFAYYNDPPGGVQHWYVNHSVLASSRQSGVRWYEFQAPQIAITPPALAAGPHQTGTYAPDANWRWMGSVAADRNDDILAGYSLSSSTVYPSIEVAGRLKTDAGGTLEPEISVVAGTGSQTGTANRWGDFSAMRLDPDGCTFWYTTEYYPVTGQFAWSTQIASARFSTCQNPSYNGYIELCKQSDPDNPVTGTFDFTLTSQFFNGGPYHVPVGTCSPPIQAPAGVLTVTEAPKAGVAVENVSAYSYDQFGNYINELDSWTPPNLTANVTVMPGGVNLETVATFTNYAAPPGALKICKIAGPGIVLGRTFNFTVSATGTRRYPVPAGPPPGGSCQIIGSFPVNSPLVVSEVLPGDAVVSNITVEPPQRGGTQTANSVVVTIGTGVTEVDFTDTSAQACAGQSLITIDPVNNIGYAPIFQQDAQGNSQIAVVNLAVGVPHPVIKTISLPGATDRPLAATYNPGNQTMLIEAAAFGNNGNPDVVNVYVINAATQSYTGTMISTNLDFNGSEGGGIFADTINNRALVAGSSHMGALNGINGASPTWNAASSISTVFTDSMSFNPATNTVFIAGDGTNATVSVPPGGPFVQTAFESDFGLTDGNAFDPFTNILSLSPEVAEDQSWAFNFATLSGGTANNVVVPTVCLNGGTGCLAELAPIWEGPGGQAAINCSTHQSVVVDEGGQNLKVVQLPRLPVPVTTPLDNNGRPGSGTPPDAASAYTIAATIIPKGNIPGGQQNIQLGAIGDPNSVTIDPTHNFAYMLASSGNTWNSGHLFLVRVDLSNPTIGGSPIGGVDGSTYWNLTAPSIAIPMPPDPD